MARSHIADRQFEPSPYNAEVHIRSRMSGICLTDPPRRKVAIVGAGVGREHAPYDDPEWEVWSLNAVPSLDSSGRLRADRWFEMHVRAAQSEKDLRWIKACPVPIYLVPSWADLNPVAEAPTYVRYPLEAVERRFGSYFTNSFAYEMALAIHEKFTTVGLYGCELAFGTERERTVEWACLSWWMGLAEGIGVEVKLPPISFLGSHRYRYGVEYYEEKRYVELYVDRLRRGDRARGVDAAAPYDSAEDPLFTQGG